jgi:hypothetical protein
MEPKDLLNRVTYVEKSPGLSGNMEFGTGDKLTIREIWRQFNIKIAIILLFSFYTFSIYWAISRSGTAVYNASYL